MLSQRNTVRRRRRKKKKLIETATYKKRWKDHVHRMAGEKWPKIAWNYRPIWQRVTGRPRACCAEKMLKLVQALIHEDKKKKKKKKKHYESIAGFQDLDFVKFIINFFQRNLCFCH
jgi:hypothetical protein